MQLLFFATFVALAIARVSSQSSEFGPGSGKESCFSLATEPPSEPEESVLATVRCHLACISLSFTESFREKRGNHSVWPYYVLADDTDCTVYRQLEECSRGCLQRILNEDHNLRSCKEHCKAECEEVCRDTTSCPCDCKQKWCRPGCKDASEILNSNDDTSNPPAPSLALVATNESEGEYFVNLTESAQNLESRNDYIGPTGFIIKIRNTQTDWVTYIGKNSPQVTISLAEYDCMAVAVSFAAVSKHGISNYSPEHTYGVNVIIDGDSTALPGTVENLTVEAELDTRLQFFGHAVLRIAWDPPQQNEYLDHYIVEISPNAVGTCGTEYSFGPLNETTLTVQASSMSGFNPLINCRYTINVYSKPGSQSSGKNITTPGYSLGVNLTCNRVPRDWYFSFYINWTVPEQVAYEPAINYFKVFKDLLNSKGKVLDDYSTHRTRAEKNKTAYMFFVNDDNMGPQPDQSKYRLQMGIYFQSKFRLQIISVSCPLFDATAPLPMPVQNLELDSYCTLNDMEIQLNFSWTPPTEVFGELTEYEVSLGPGILTAREEITVNGFYTSKIAMDITTASWITPFFFHDTDTLYFQMRAHSNWSVASNWTEPKVITRAELEVESISCHPFDATSPLPMTVQNLTLDSYCTLNDNEIQINFSWTPPTEVFGELTEYEVSLGPGILTAREEITVNGFYTSKIAMDITTASWITPFFFHDTDTLYFQMRAHSNWSVASNWTEPKVITRAELEVESISCHLFDATSPLPMTIQNLTLDSYCTLNDNEIQLNFSWVLPLRELIEYELSLGPGILAPTEEPTANGFITSKIAVNITTASWSTQFVFNQNSDTLFFQMRAHGNWSISSDWTEPEVIIVALLNGCVNANHAQRLEYIYGIVAGIVIVTIGLLFLAILVYTHYKLRKRKRQLEEIMDESNLDPMFSMGPKKMVFKNPDVALLADAWELHPNNVIVEECLGEGAFGEVFKGIIKGAISNPKIRPSLKNAICTTVAVKLLKATAKGSERRDFLQEIEMMKKVSEGQNAHVVSMVGCVTIQEPLCLITEFVKHGDLLTYLRTNRKLHTREAEDDFENPYYDLGSICPHDLISFAYQIASGMEYLSSLGIVHRDLACRNVLVDEGKVLKITDFGMSRETDEIYVQKTQGRVPLKWMAIESIVAREFTTASDVWSYGVLLWEIGTLGGFPYPSIQNEDLLTLLKSGHRMEKPSNCSPEVYDIMLQCWVEEAKKRPTFTQLRAKFDAMLLDGRKDAYIDLRIDFEQPHYQKDQLQVSPALKRRSQLSIADIQAFMSELEKSPSCKSTSSFVQGSPRHSRLSLLGASPSHERSKLSRPSSMLAPRASEHTQPMNPYVDDPSNLARGLAPTTARAVSSSPRMSRVNSEVNLPGSTEGRERPTNIHITITSEP